jgi:hypothetical protein
MITHFPMRKIQLLLIVFLFICLPIAAVADDVTDSINEALEQYKKGEYAGAMGSLNYASQLIGQKKGEALEALLPKELPGWTPEKATSQAAGAAMFGGGITAERIYRKDDRDVTVSIITDSPMLQGLMVMFNNPMFATADGGKLEKINGQKAIVKYDAEGKNGEIQMVIANRFLVKVSGNNVEQQDLKEYASAIDFNKLAGLP